MSSKRIEPITFRCNNCDTEGKGTVTISPITHHCYGMTLPEHWVCNCAQQGTFWITRFSCYNCNLPKTA